MVATLTALTPLAGLDAPTATIVAAIVGGFMMVAARWAPKTRSEAAVDRSKVVVDERERWRILFDEQEKALKRRDDDAARRDAQHAAEIATFRSELDEVRNELAEERRECDRQISDLSKQVIRLSRAIPPRRVWFFDEDQTPT